MKIFIASDHAGFEMKNQIKNYLMGLGLGYEVFDMGALIEDKNDDYPDYVMPLAESVAQDKDSVGIILGGSGQGEAMCANKVKGIRAGVFYGQMEPKSGVDVKEVESNDSFEIVKLMREHNDANILSLGARFITADEAKFACELFLNAKLSGDERHIRRISKF